MGSPRHNSAPGAGATQTPLQIQLAIQGGGAKLCALLAAAEAVQELEAEGKITLGGETEDEYVV